MKTNTVAAVTAALLCLVGAGGPAWSLTGADVLDKMSADERAGYLAGTVDMAAFLAATQGQAQRTDCIMGWYYHQDGAKTIIAGLARYRDREALPVVHALIGRACGK